MQVVFPAISIPKSKSTHPHPYSHPPPPRATVTMMEWSMAFFLLGPKELFSGIYFPVKWHLPRQRSKAPTEVCGPCLIPDARSKHLLHWSLAGFKTTAA